MFPERILYSHISTLKDHSPDKLVTKSICPTAELTTRSVLNRFLQCCNKYVGGKSRRPLTHTATTALSQLCLSKGILPLIPAIRNLLSKRLYHVHDSPPDLSNRDLSNPFNYSYLCWPHHIAANSTTQWCTGLMLLPDKNKHQSQYFPYITCSFQSITSPSRAIRTF